MQSLRYISPFEFAVMLSAGVLGYGIFQFPRELVSGAGPDSLYGLMLELAWGLGVLWLWFRVNRLRPNQSAFYLPKVLAWPAAIITLAVHLTLAFTALANFGFIMQDFFLPGTPIWAIDAVTLGVAVYMASYGLAPLVRTLGVSYLLPIFFSAMMGFVLWGHVHDMYAWLPSSHIYLMPTLTGAYRNAYIFFGLEITANSYQFIRPGERRKAERYGYWAVVGTFLFLTYGYLLAMGVEGPFFLMHIQWPLVSLNRLVSISGLLINKLGLLVVVFWGLILLSFASLRIWCIVHDVMPFIKIRNLSAYRWAVVIVGAVIWMMATRVPNIVVLSEFVLNYGVPSVIIYMLGMPLFILSVHALSRMIHRRRTRAPSLNPSEG